MVKSFISKKELHKSSAIMGREIREEIFNLIKIDFPDFSADDYISIDELNRYRRIFISQLVEQEKGELEAIDLDVVNAIRNNSILSENIEDTIDSKFTFGQHVADKIATFGGSWTFIFIFLSILFSWMIINVWILVTKPFDPYPFILLNLFLSCIAAIQAPIIMMSQNRQEQKDRIKAENDYKINLKAELEIKLISEKIDHLLVNQNKKLMEFQELQIDYLEDLMNRVKGNKQ
ncbi:MAG: DUF1003 domain-containing protein [Bacteroidales bacterium]|nr:DUF1003 domain-containing protein [Bacteroidales bacterium]